MHTNHIKLKKQLISILNKYNKNKHILQVSFQQTTTKKV